MSLEDNKMKVMVSLLLLMYCFSAQATSLKNEINLSWLSEHIEDVEKNLSNHNTYQLIPVINLLSDIWYNRDGATTGEVSIPIIKALIFHPELMLPMLIEKTDSFERWLLQFNGIVFTDFSGDNAEDLKLLHKKLTESMSNFIAHCDVELKPYAHKILKQLEITEVRVIH